MLAPANAAPRRHSWCFLPVSRRTSSGSGSADIHHRYSGHSYGGGSGYPAMHRYWRYEDGSNADITASVTWASSATAVASIDSTGLATGVSVGLTSISASQGGVSSDSVSLEVTAAPPPPPAGSVATVTGVDHVLTGGKGGDKDLRVIVHVADDLGNPVEGASVSITLNYITSSASWTAKGTTVSDGSAAFRLRNAPTGCYSTTVDNLVAAGLDWDDYGGPFGGSVCKSGNGNRSGALQTD